MIRNLCRVAAVFIGAFMLVAICLIANVPAHAAAACAENSATTLIPSRVELPAGYKASTPVVLSDGRILQIGEVLTAKAVTAQPFNAPINTRACGISHIPYAPIGFIDWFRVSG